jgi:hypothetical protein
VHAEAVALAGADARQVAVPVEGGPLVEPEALLVVIAVEQTEVNRLGVFREEREVGAVPVPDRAEGKRRPGPDLA